MNPTNDQEEAVSHFWDCPVCHEEHDGKPSPLDQYNLGQYVEIKARAQMFDELVKRELVPDVYIGIVKNRVMKAKNEWLHRFD